MDISALSDMPARKELVADVTILLNTAKEMELLEIVRRQEERE